MTKLLHVAEAAPDARLWPNVFLEALKEIGSLEILENGGEMSDDRRAAAMRACDILLLGWGAARCPESLASEPGNLKYICNITGELNRFVPLSIIESGIPVTNWGDRPANRVAEGAMTLLLATLKDLHHQIDLIRNDGWQMDMSLRGGTLKGAQVGIYGLGVVGRRFVEMLRPFGAKMRVFDPYLQELPADCERVDSLEALFEGAQIVAIHAALTDETRKSVTADHLAMLPRHGVVVNTARGAIVDQAALFAELKSGRLRAGLDVLDPDNLPEGHEARTWPNLILTAHRVEYGWPDFGEPPTELNEMQSICLDNLNRFQRGDDLRFTYDKTRYLRSS